MTYGAHVLTKPCRHGLFGDLSLVYPPMFHQKDSCSGRKSEENGRRTFEVSVNCEVDRDAILHCVNPETLLHRSLASHAASRCHQKLGLHMDREHGFHWVSESGAEPDVALWQHGEWWPAGNEEPTPPTLIEGLSERLRLAPRLLAAA